MYRWCSSHRELRMSNYDSETPSTVDVSSLLKEHSQLSVEVARLSGTLERCTRQTALLLEAALQALEYVTEPNPYVAPDQLRIRIVARLEDALEANGCQVKRFDVKSDAN